MMYGLILVVQEPVVICLAALVIDPHEVISCQHQPQPFENNTYNLITMKWPEIHHTKQNGSRISFALAFNSRVTFE